MIDSLLVIGRTAGFEAIVADALRTARSVRVFQNVSDALADDPPAALILVLQHWSDEYPPSEIRQLLERFVLSRFIVCLGEWCLSDRRTRQYWPPAMCVFADGAGRRLAQEREVIAGERSALPWTAGLDEIFVFDHGDDFENHER